MKAYYQFNENNGNISINKALGVNYANYNGFSGANHNPSNAPVFGGKSEKININTSGVKTFSSTGLSINFANGTYPDGDVWVSRGRINPDVLPDTLQNLHSYTIVNNYGKNESFTPIESITFSGNPEYSSTDSINYNLYKRNSNDFGDSWGTILENSNLVSGESGVNTQVSFANDLTINSFSQFVLSNNNLNIDTIMNLDGDTAENDTTDNYSDTNTDLTNINDLEHKNIPKYIQTL